LLLLALKCQTNLPKIRKRRESISYFMQRFLILFLAITLTTNGYAQKAQVWMLGPMLHFNISEKKMHASFGIELAYWNYEHFPYSVDAGIDFEKKKIRLYSEGQAGIGLLGLSMGPVLEIRTDESRILAGIQGSFWANYFGGFDLRFRKTGGKGVFAPGLYFKLPVGIGAESDGDYDDWDWDD
jgi:hypothetical protein